MLPRGACHPGHGQGSERPGLRGLRPGGRRGGEAARLGGRGRADRLPQLTREVARRGRRQAGPAHVRVFLAGTCFPVSPARCTATSPSANCRTCSSRTIARASERGTSPIRTFRRRCGVASSRSSCPSSAASTTSRIIQVTWWRGVRSFVLVVDALFSLPRLAAVYDPLDPGRPDLEVYAAMAAEFGARRVLDIGCGTGTFACLLASRGLTVAGLDPALASLEIARA